MLTNILEVFAVFVNQYTWENKQLCSSARRDVKWEWEMNVWECLQRIVPWWNVWQWLSVGKLSGGKKCPGHEWSQLN